MGQRRTTVSEPKDPNTLLVNAKADGLNVRSRDGDRLGHIYAYMVDKRSGQTSYAVLSLGGFLGMGKSFYPLPFGLLAYDAVDDVYVVTVDRRVLEGGPSWANNAPEFNQAYADRVSSYYGVDPVNVSRS
nr:PRC-barrel domain-containing protein [Sphingobium baderi]